MKGKAVAVGSNVSPGFKVTVGKAGVRVTLGTRVTGRTVLVAVMIREMVWEPSRKINARLPITIARESKAAKTPKIN